MAPVTMNDGVLLGALLYLAVDVSLEWSRFENCARPIQLWLFCSYTAVLIFRALYLLGAAHSESSAKGCFLLNLRQTNCVSKAAMLFIWMVALPSYCAWTVVGTNWLWKVQALSPQCIPPDQNSWFIILWFVVSYLWVLIHALLLVMACIFERRVRTAESRLRQIEGSDADVSSRWGQVSQLADYCAMDSCADRGLAPEEILALPVHTACTRCVGEKDCSICLCAISEGDTIRHLDSCQHTFHKSCIDLWLLRQADCPLCKREVKSREH